MTEKYENIDLDKEEVSILQKMEVTFGVPIPHIDIITWEDFRMTKKTHQLEKINQHQFGFIAKDNHVVELGLSYENLNIKKLKNINNYIPDISVFQKLKALDLHGWDKIFAKYFDEIERREENLSLAYEGGGGIGFKSSEERWKIQDEANRAVNAPIDEISHDDLYHELKKLVELESLILSKCHFEEFNFIKSLENKKKLQFLDLSDNEITQFSGESSILNDLKKLILKNNPIERYPSALENAKSLKLLDLSETKLKELPDIISNLVILETLILPRGITEFSDSFFQLKNLKNLVTSNISGKFKEFTNLKSLTITNGNMEELIDVLSELSSLNNLKIDNCRSLTTLPDIFGSLKNITSLEITGNTALENLPASIFTMKNLKTLNLFNNNLKSLPDGFGNLLRLEILDLGNNQLKYIPYSIYKLNNLIDFTIDNNPLEKNDKIISGKTLPEIKTYSKKKMSINVFISHAVVDFEPCRIQELSLYLESQLEINKSFFCERDLGGNIDSFMNKNVPNSQLVLFIGTPTSINSIDCGYELKLSREYDIDVVPIKTKDLDWPDLGKIGLSRELGLEVDFSDKEKFDEFCSNLYDYITQLKRQIDLFDKEQGKIDRLTSGLKIIEKKMEKLTQTIDNLDERLKKIE